jgi:hypothetical protein
LVEIWRARSGSRRIVFAVGLALGLVGLFLERNRFGVVEWLALSGGLITTFGGGAALYLRLRACQRLSPMLERAERDLGHGEVLCFQAEADGTGENEDYAASAIEILPTSCLAYRVAGEVVEGWLVLEPHWAAGSPENAGETPWFDDLGAPTAPGDWLRTQRPMEAKEVGELNCLTTRMLSHFALEGPCAIILATAALLAIEAVLGEERRPWFIELGWFLAALAAVAGFGVRVRRYLQLRKDARKGRLMILRPQRREMFAMVELLPCSRMIWTVDGDPASWRRR